MDDTPANLQLLVELLSKRGHRIRPVTSGEMALRAVAASKPDLVLLDVNMPGLNGYDVCRRLKANEDTKDLPVIFLSALDEPSVKVLAFQCGGVDYVTKPFHVDEVVARVDTHLKIRDQRLSLAEQNAKLLEMERLRDGLVHMLVHDMRSPLLGANLNLELLQDSVAGDPEAERILLDARKCTKTLVQMVDQMLDVSRLEAKSMPISKTLVDLPSLVEVVLQETNAMLRDRAVTLHAGKGLEAPCDVPLLKRVLTNLLHNAAKYTRPGGKITLRALRADGGVKVEIEDDGVGIPEEKLGAVFDKFSQVSTHDARRGHGLGLAFVKLVVESHGGCVGVSSVVGQRTIFWFTLPS